MKTMLSVVWLSITAIGSFGQEVVIAGEGLVKCPPDLASAVLVIEDRRASNVDEAQGKVSKTLTEVKAGLTKLSTVRMSPIRYEVGENLEYNRKSGEYARNGYKASMSIELRIDDLVQLPGTLTLAEIPGVAELGNLQFNVRERKKLELQAIENAIKDALSKAETIARSLGKTGAELMRIQEKDVSFTDPFSLHVSVGGRIPSAIGAGVMADTGGRGRRSEPFITPATIEIRADVVALVKLR